MIFLTVTWGNDPFAVNTNGHWRNGRKSGGASKLAHHFLVFDVRPSVAFLKLITDIFGVRFDGS